MHFVSLLHCVAHSVRCVHELARKSLIARLLAALSHESHEPTNAQSLPSLFADLLRDLIGRAADPSRLHLDLRHHIGKRLLEYLDRAGAGLFFYNMKCPVNDALRSTLLTVKHDLIDEFGHALVVIDRIGKHVTLRHTTSSWHTKLSPYILILIVVLLRYYLDFFAPYLLRACLRFATPAVSSAPRTI